MQKFEISKGVKIALLVTAVIVGVLFCCLGITMFNVLFTIIGGLIAFGGLFAIFRKHIFAGLIITGLGALIIVAAWKWTNVSYIIFGVMMIISAVGGFISSVMMEDGRRCISSVITAVLGGFLVGFREGADWMIFVIGALFIILGIIGIILVLIPRRSGEKRVKTVDVKPIDEEVK